MKREEIVQYIRNGSRQRGIPCGLWMHFAEACATGEPSVHAHLKYYSETNIDIVKIMNEHPMKFFLKVKSPEDWAKITPSQIDKSGYVDYLEEIKELRKKLGPNSFILATIHGVLVSACHATDGVGHFPNLNNTITMHLKENPEIVGKGLRSIGEVLQHLCLMALEAGADGIYYAALGAEENRFTEDMYRKYVSPIEKGILASCKKKGVVFLHVCKENPRLPMFSDYPCDVVNWDENRGSYSLEEGMRLFSDKIIMGGFDNKVGVLFSGTDNDVVKHINDTIRRVGRGRIIVGADCTLPSTFNTKRIKMIADYCSSLEQEEIK